MLLNFYLLEQKCTKHTRNIDFNVNNPKILSFTSMGTRVLPSPAKRDCRSPLKKTPLNSFSGRVTVLHRVLLPRDKDDGGERILRGPCDSGISNMSVILCRWVCTRFTLRPTVRKGHDAPRLRNALRCYGRVRSLSDTVQRRLRSQSDSHSSCDSHDSRATVTELTSQGSLQDR